MVKKWWHNKVAYQIYPKSFMDSNGDGIGDIPGIISKLDYLKDLGVDILWICPIYESPFVDQGYDISDYYEIAECFGTMEDFDNLLDEAKKPDMYIIMDLVINHCSDKHEWFQKALADPDGEFAERFYFEKARADHEPSNYRSYFGGNMWEPVPGREDLYYLHSFAKQQPDLNWNNEPVLEYLYDMVNWWLDKGVSGFRIDAIINIRKNTQFPSYEADGPDGLCSVDKVIEGAAKYEIGPYIGEMLHDLKKNTFSKPDREEAFTVGEVFNMQEDCLAEFIGDEGHFSTIFDFCLHILTNCESGWYMAREIVFAEMRKAIFDSKMATQHAGLMANIIENHDEPRAISVFLPEWIDIITGAKLLGTVMFLLHGIPFIYQGQEIGMTNKKFNSLDEFDDISTIDQYNQAMEHGFTPEKALDMCNMYSRDNARTPMQWSDEHEAGFTSGKPWSDVNPNYTEINVAVQQDDENSVLNYYKKLIALRKMSCYEDAFVYGEFKPAYMEYDDVLAYYRIGKEHTILVLSNWGKDEITVELSDKDVKRKVLLSNMGELPDVHNGAGRMVEGKKESLASGQVVVYEVG